MLCTYKWSTAYTLMKDGTLSKVDSLTNSYNNFNPSAQDPAVVITRMISNYAYEWWDGAKQTAITLDPVSTGYDPQRPQPPGYSVFGYDVNGHLKTASDINRTTPRTFEYWTNAEGQVLQRQELVGGTVNSQTVVVTGASKSRDHRYFYFDGKRVGNVGNDGVEREDYAQQLARSAAAQSPDDKYRKFIPTNSADFDENYQPINASFPGPAPGSYTVREGDTLENIARALWGEGHSVPGPIDADERFKIMRYFADGPSGAGLPGVQAGISSAARNASALGSTADGLANVPQGIMMTSVNQKAAVYVSRWMNDGGKEARALHATDPSIAGLLNWLKSVEDKPFDWRKATADFKAVVAEEQALRQARIQAHEAYARLAALHNEIPATDRACDANAMEMRIATDRTPLLDAECDRAVRKIEDAQSARQKHRHFRPGIVEIVMTLGRAFKEWRSKDKVMETAIDDARKAVEENTQARAEHSAKIDSIKREEQRLHATGERLRKERATANEHLRSMKDQLGPAFPMVAQWQEMENDRELSSPWADAPWNEARTKVFLAALKLHKAFVLANPSAMRKSLQGSMDILSGSVPSDAAPEAVRAAWTALFFLVPVVCLAAATSNARSCGLHRPSLHAANAQSQACRACDKGPELRHQAAQALCAHHRHQA
jgi:hypothetical protein